MRSSRTGATQAAGGLIEPAAIVVLGGIIALVIVGVVLALTSLSTSGSRTGFAQVFTVFATPADAIPARLHAAGDAGVLVIIGLVAGLVGPRMFSKVDSSKCRPRRADQAAAWPRSRRCAWMWASTRRSTSAWRCWSRRRPTRRCARAGRVRTSTKRVPLDPGATVQYAIPGAEGRPFSIISFGADARPAARAMMPTSASPARRPPRSAEHAAAVRRPSSFSSASGFT